MTSWAIRPLTTELWMKHLNETDVDSVALTVPTQTECLETSVPQSPSVSTYFGYETHRVGWEKNFHCR